MTATRRDVHEHSFAEIATKRFRTVTRGWDVTEARAFLYEVASSYEELLQEVRALRSLRSRGVKLEEELRERTASSRELMVNIGDAGVTFSTYRQCVNPDLLGHSANEAVPHEVAMTDSRPQAT
jgi:cell division septum initiation protein DivIVA